MDAIRHRAWLALVGLLTARFVSAQQLSPLTGQGTAPPGDTVVETSVYLDRLLGIDQYSYLYTAVWYVYMQWMDPRVNTSTVAATNNPSCQTFCDSSNIPTFGCCDNVYRPNIQLPNLYALSQDRNVRSSITVDDSGTVVWWTRIMATFYSPMAFDAYPFDSQHLTLELQLDDPYDASQSARVGLKLGTFPPSVLQNTPHGRGAHVSGWVLDVDEMQYYQFNCFSCLDNAISTYTSVNNMTNFTAADAYSDAGSDALARYALNIYSPGQLYVQQDPNLVKQAHLVLCDSQNRETLQMLPPLSFVVDLKVSRVRSYEALNTILPVMLVAYISFLVFFMDKAALEARVGCIVTLFLALTALQFTINYPAASRLTAIQQLILLTYIELFVTSVETLVVYFCVSWHTIHHNFQAREVARGQLVQRLVDQSLLDPVDAERQLRRRKTAEGGTQSADAAALAAGANPAPKVPTIQAGLVRAPSRRAPDITRADSTQPLSMTDMESGVDGIDSAGEPRPAPKAGCGFGIGVPGVLSRRGRGRTRTALDHIRESPEFAGWVGYQVDRWTVIIMFVGYNLCAALILIINATCYNDRLAIGKYNGAPE